MGFDINSMEFKEINDAAALLTAELMDPVTRVTYEDFVRNGLPLLAKAGPEFPIDAWIAYVGHVYVRLEVLNPDGSVRYAIPAFFDQQRTRVGHGDHLGNHMEELAMLRRTSPVFAGRAFINALEKLSDPDYDGAKSANEMEAVLNQIYADHNMPNPLQITSPTQITTQQQPQETGITIQDYDEL